ncbi:MAG: methyltransferase domain-containing protein [Oculatellaceae cyanobacterium Prado106]|jgi:ubiquinone/menaquinone biosynthesis C-methylase UbiE|nr:methyltransferase domain-containing protein [Oculatellaceae cyanobacterium Prado106]
MVDTLTKLAYQTFQQGKATFGIAHKTLTTQLMSLVAPTAKSETETLSPDILRSLQQRLGVLTEQDLQDAEQGIYPAEMLFDNPWDDFFRYYPVVWMDIPTIWDRISAKQYQTFSPDIQTEGYPNYYVQNFHHQTNGYLSDMSANLYDLQVELLFNGTADAMRRRILAPMKQALSGISKPLLLDIACGTGRTLRFLRGAFPDASLYGVDLSPAYLRKANQLLSEIPGTLPQLLQANAEDLPYRDNYFHGVSSVFMFHELPPEARQRVIEECYRVLQPGGIFVICDSMQEEDSPEFAPMMRNFPAMFHEPYYRHYIQDNLGDRLQQAGFATVETKVHFVSKYWIARKAES